MSETEIEIVFRGPKFYSSLDEECYFHFVNKITCITRKFGLGYNYHIIVAKKDLSVDSLRELIGLFQRYRLDMKQLARLESKETKPFLRNEKAFWFSAMFAEPRNKRMT